MSFNEEAIIRLPFKKHRNKSVYHKVINNNKKWFVPGGRTKTYLALKQANETIFKRASPLNHRPDVNDVIVLITDGLPSKTRIQKDVYNYTVSLARSLKQKGIRIVGIGYSDFGKRLANSIKDISTRDEVIITALDDIGMIVDRVIDGICPQPRLGKVLYFYNNI